MASKSQSLQAQAKEILKKAKETGLESNFFFSTTFDRYLTQIRILKSLEETINKMDTLVEKEYVKGRKNVVTNPAITEYNRTASAANKTVETLIRVLNNFSAAREKEETDPVMEILSK